MVVCLSNSVPPNPNANLEAVQRRWMLNLSRVMIYSENFAEWPGEEEGGGGRGRRNKGGGDCESACEVGNGERERCSFESERMNGWTNNECAGSGETINPSAPTEYSSLILLTKLPEGKTITTAK